MEKLLIANRGEIALRVVRTAREMGIATVAVYMEPDRDSLFARLADEAYLLPGETYNETYLNEDLIIEIAKRSGADAIHPGYGFLSEISSFATKVSAASITWVGPDPSVLDELGDKITARRFAQRAKVPPVPGISEPVSSIQPLLDFGHEHGYPIMMKRTDGGGGRGITVVNNDDELRAFYMSHDALQGGDLDEYFIEKFVPSARHVETQSGRDSHGNFTVYSTRDCSVQRRNQKLVEEAPAPFLSSDVRSQLEGFSRRLFEAAGYQGLGTCEFMVTPESKVYFLEVNPRLQVEHTVSEEVCGLDLVREQLVIASGGELTPAPQSRGHSFELRITSEDPATNLTPASGTLERINWPSGPGIRVDSGVAAGDVISAKFDSLMGKLVVTASSRVAAIERVRRALAELDIEGVPTPKELFGKIFSDSDFTGEDEDFLVTTKWLEHKYLAQKPESIKSGQPASLTASQGGESTSEREEHETFVIEIDNKRVHLSLPPELFSAGADPRTRKDRPASQPLRGRGSRAEVGAEHDSNPGANGEISAPMQAVVTRVCVAPGQAVAKGDLLIVLESMKMENYVYSPLDGRIEEILVGASQGVDAGETLVRLAQPVAETANSAAPDAAQNTAQKEETK
jgi:acetyl-CoA/propionyl-CoA carboxylase biotin carboxyl carrier protein